MRHCYVCAEGPTSLADVRELRLPLCHGHRERLLALCAELDVELLPWQLAYFPEPELPLLEPPC